MIYDHFDYQLDIESSREKDSFHTYWVREVAGDDESFSSRLYNFVIL